MDELDELIDETSQWLTCSQHQNAQNYAKELQQITRDLFETPVSLKIKYASYNSAESYKKENAISDIRVICKKLKLVRYKNNRELKMAELNVQANNIRISQNASQATSTSVTSDIDITNTITKIEQSDLDESDRETLTKLVKQMEANAKKKDKSGFVDKLTKSLNIAQNSVALISTILTIAEQISPMLIK